MVKKMTVAEYITQQVALSGKTQKEIAKECGYSNPNIIAMFKSGATPVPREKVGLLAMAFGVHPSKLLQLVFSEYDPEAWTLMEQILGPGNFFSPEEISFARFILKTAEEHNIDLTVPENMDVVRASIASAADHERAKTQASIDASKRRKGTRRRG